MSWIRIVLLPFVYLLRSIVGLFTWVLIALVLLFYSIVYGPKGTLKGMATIIAGGYKRK